MVTLRVVCVSERRDLSGMQEGEKSRVVECRGWGQIEVLLAHELHVPVGLCE